MKKWMKTVAVTLAAIFVIQILPLSVMAEEVNKPKETETTTETGESVILGEVEESRDEYAKVYRRADGTLTELRSAQAIHFKKDGAWQEIDNTLTGEKNEKGQAVLTNRTGPFKAELPRTMETGKEVRLEKGGHAVAFSPSGDWMKKSAGAKIEKTKEEKGQSEAEKSAKLSKTQSKVTYEQVSQNTNLEYIVQADGVKENIVVEKEPSAPETYEFTVQAEHLEARLQKDNSIRFTDEKGDAVFTIPAPVMYDAGYRMSKDIKVAFAKEGESAYRLTYTPSMDWMTQKGRTYPVIVDPVIQIAHGSDGRLKDTTISEPDYADVSFSTLPYSLVSTYQKDEFDHANALYDFRGILPSGGNLKVITSAVLKLTTSKPADVTGLGINVTAHRVTSDWNASTVTYNTKPTYDTKVLDYFTATTADMSVNTLDLTEVMNGWLSGAYPNYGIQLATTDNGAVVIGSNETPEDMAPVLEITYREMNGIDGTSPTHTMSAEDAGTVYWNDLNGVVNVEREDLSLPGNIMPVSIKRVYRSVESDLINPYGTGWIINYAQKLSYDGSNFRYTDDRGAVRTFIKQNDLTEDGRMFWKEEASNSMGISTTMVLLDKGNTNPRTYTALSLEKPDGTTLRFDSSGRLSTITDSSKKKNKITITYIGSGIDTITDGVGRQFKFLYPSVSGEVASLAAIECRDSTGAPITFETDDGQTVPLRVDYTYQKINALDKKLTKISRPGGKTVEYTYGETAFTLKDSGKGIVECALSERRCQKLTKKVWDADSASYLLHSSLELTTDGRSQKTYTDHTGAAEILQYDTAGHVVSRRQKGGEAVFSSFGADGAESVSPSMTTNVNVLKNPGFSNNMKSWTLPSGVKGSAEVVGEEAHSAGNSCKVLPEYATPSTPYLVSQTVDGAKAGEYTLSAYFKTAGGETGAGGALLKLTALDRGGNVLESKTSLPISTTNGLWQQVSLSFAAPAGTAKVMASFGQGETAPLYVDDVQLVCSSVSETAAARYNYIKNGDFTRSGTLSSAEEWSWTIFQSGGRTTISPDDTRDTGLDNKAYHMNGTSRTLVTTTQNVPISGKKGENFTIAGWAKGPDAVPTAENSGRLFGIKVEALKGDGAYELLKKVEFLHGINGWQYLGETFSLDRDITEVRVSLCYHKEFGTAYFDGIQLYKEDWMSTENSSSGSDSGKDDKVCPCEKCSEPNCACRCASEAACTCPQCKRYTKVSTNDNGNALETINTDGNKSIKTINSYVDDGNYLKSMRTSGLTTINYNYDTKSGYLKSKDGENYGYDAIGNLVHMTQEIGNRQVISNRYIYDGDQMKKILHNGFEYSVDQNAFGNMTKLNIGTQNYVTNEYSENYQQILKSTFFGNKQKILFQYNQQNQLTGLSHDGGKTQRFQFAYGYDGLKSSFDTQTNTKTEYTETGLKKWNTLTSSLIYLQDKDDKGNERELVNGCARYTIVQGKGNRDASTGKTTNGYTLTGNPVKMNFTSTTDYFGRLESKMATVTIGDRGLANYGQTTTVRYCDVTGTDETTSQIASYQQSYLGLIPTFNETNRYEYTYTSKGDIRTIRKNGTLLRTYYYDQAGQLTQEINHELGSVNVYHYDAGGNLSYCNSGSFDPDHITPLWKDKTYTYGDTNWKDKLTAYNGKPITYDEIGNPLTYDGWTYTWEAGRQLKKQEKGTTSIEYTYDENGLRTQKKSTENGKTTVYDYVWKGEKLIGLTIDASIRTDYLYFFYDEDGKASGFVHNNKDVYFYQTDAQGNVNALVNQNGSTAAEYTYDAWGKLLSSKGEMAKINPLTYRGYQYDQETGLYYLQSRYYNPEWGRFINADNGFTGTSILSNNLFTYCNNNPIGYIDITGKSPLSPLRGKNLTKEEKGEALFGALMLLFCKNQLLGDNYWDIVKGSDYFSRFDELLDIFDKAYKIDLEGLEKDSWMYKLAVYLKLNLVKGEERKLAAFNFGGVKLDLLLSVGWGTNASGGISFNPHADGFDIGISAIMGACSFTYGLGFTWGHTSIFYSVSYSPKDFGPYIAIGVTATISNISLALAVAACAVVPGLAPLVAELALGASASLPAIEATLFMLMQLKYAQAFG